jgi:hypothetical protein
MQGDSSDPKGEVALRVSLHDRIAAQKSNASCRIVALEVLGEWVIQARLAESALQILKLTRLPDLHQSEDIGIYCSDHPDDRFLLRVRLSRLGVKLAMNPPSHGEVILHIVGRNPKLPGKGTRLYWGDFNCKCN